MLNLFIVEDEAICREGLMNIQWNDIGINLAGVAADGEGALKQIQKKKCDIVLSDIRLPKQTGLWLAKQISLLMPQIKVILITAFDDFGYAQEAIKYGVAEYLLKPINPKAVLESVDTVAKQIMVERANETDMRSLEKQIKENRFLLKDWFLSACLRNEGDANKALSVFGVDADKKRAYIVINIAFLIEQDSSYEYKSFSSFKNISKIIETEAVECTPFFEQDAYIYVLGFDAANSERTILAHTFSAAEKIVNYLKFNCRISFSIGIGRVAASYKGIPASFKDSCDALNFRFYIGNNQAIYIDDVEPAKGNAGFKLIKEKDFTNLLKMGDIAQLLEMLEEIFKTFKENCENIDTIKHTYLEFIIYVSKVLHAADQNPSKFFSVSDSLNILDKNVTIEELHKDLQNIFRETALFFQSSRNTKNKEIIERVKQIIDENYNKDISLTMIAEKVFISSCYLSTIFNKETNTTLTDYITQVRVSKAKKLLKSTGLKIFEISNRVGYDNPKYFSHIFNKVTGLLPSQYRSKGN